MLEYVKQKIGTLLEKKTLAFYVFLFIAAKIVALWAIFNFLNKKELENAYKIEDENARRLVGNMEYVIGTISGNILEKTNAIYKHFGKYFSQKIFEEILMFESIPINTVITSFLWIPQVKYEYIHDFETRCSSNIKQGCIIFEESKMPPNYTAGVSKRDIYYPVAYVYPPIYSYEDNLVGFDMLSNNITKEYIDIATSSRNLTLTPRINIFTETNSTEYGTILSKSLFDETFENIIGIAMCIVNINRIVDYVINTDYGGFRIYDIEMLILDDIANDKNDKNIIYKSNNFPPSHTSISNDIDSNIYHIKSFSTADVNWKVHIKFSSGYRGRIMANNSIILIILLASFTTLIEILFVTITFFKNTKKEKIREEKKNSAARKMLGYVNHEIRNPLNGILGLVEISRDALFENMAANGEETCVFKKVVIDSIGSDLETAKRSCILIKHIVNDILDIRKLEEGKMDISISEVSIKKLFRNLNKTVTPLMDEKPGLRLSFSLPKNCNCIIMSDEHRITQILLNLMTNGIKFTFSGDIRVGFKEKNGMAVFCVRDAGRGIPYDAQKNIFKPFHQTNVSDSTRYGGIGLGLYLCNMLAKLLGGYMDFTSIPGEGTVFYLHIPIIKRDIVSV